MVDIIRGPVIYVVNEDMFDIEVTYQEKGNKCKYNNAERILIANVNAPELSSPQGKISKNALKRKVKGKEVLCYVQTRDSNGRIVADVQII